MVLKGFQQGKDIAETLKMSDVRCFILISESCLESTSIEESALEKKRPASGQSQFDHIEAYHPLSWMNFCVLFLLQLKLGPEAFASNTFLKPSKRVC